MTSLAPPLHRCSPYDIDYGTTSAQCTVCGQVWVLHARRGWQRVRRIGGGVA